MNRTLPAPICQAFLACHSINGDKITFLVDSTWLVNPTNPKRLKLAFFVRLTCAHGKTTIAVHLEDKDGHILCRDTSPDPWYPPSPLEVLDLTLRLDTDFPGVADYDLVLTANGQEISREPLFARLPQTSVDP